MIDALDLFCGAGGSSQGADAAGVSITYAVNHDELAIKTHRHNFPCTNHDQADIRYCHPRRYPRTTMLLASPECKKHARAQGKSQPRQQLDMFAPAPPPDPVAERSRATMWEVVRFTEHHRYEVVIVENIVEVLRWIGWEEWLKAMLKLDYAHTCVSLNSMFFHPIPQSRNRVYVVFWKKHNPKPKLAFRPMAWCATCHDNTHAVQSWKNKRTVGTYPAQYLYCCHRCGEEVLPYYHNAATCIDWSYPLSTIGEREHPLAATTMQRLADNLAYHYQQQPATIPESSIQADTPMPANAFISSYYSNGKNYTPLYRPLPTQPTKAKHALVLVPDRPDTLRLEDCYYRMLQPHEIRRAMGFREDYVLCGTLAEQMKLLGNAVTPPVMEALVTRCIATLQGT